MPRAIAIAMCAMLGICAVAARAPAHSLSPTPSERSPRVERLPPIEPLPTPTATANQTVEAPPVEELPKSEPDAVLDSLSTDMGEPPIIELDVCWERSLELGLNGSSGNSESFDGRFGANAKRTTKKHKFTFAMTYAKGTANSAETQNEALAETRSEWTFAETRWSYFASGTLEYDEFRAFDVRLAANNGLGYAIVQCEQWTLDGKLGAGVSHEIGGPDESYVPEALAALAGEHTLGQRQEISVSVEYYPDLTDLNEFRVNSIAKWELSMDEAGKLSLEMGAIDRYDSTPHGAKRNDLDYFALLIWKF